MHVRLLNQANHEYWVNWAIPCLILFTRIERPEEFHDMKLTLK